MIRIFSEKEDAVIQMLVKSNCSNIHYAFDKASEIIDKSPKQIRKRWYNVLRYKDSLFVTASGDCNYYNTKNVLKKKPRPDMKVSIKKARQIIVKRKKNV